MSTKTKLAEKHEAVAELQKLLKPGMTVYTLLRNVSRSGMSRVIDVFVMEEGQPRRISWTVSRACGWTLDTKRDGLKVSGCGMDMGFHVVYSLSRTLFPNGFGLPMRLAAGADGSEGTRPESPEDAALMVSKGWKARGRNGDSTGWDHDGGYALNQRWL